MMWATRRAVRLVGEELLADQLLAGKRVPQAEFGAQPAVGLLGDAAGDQSLRVDHLPVLEARRGVGVGDLLDEGALVDRREQAGALAGRRRRRR